MVKEAIARVLGETTTSAGCMMISERFEGVR